MKVLVACEFSGVVRDAFSTLGHDSWSCDLLPSERSGKHIRGDVRRLDLSEWDLVIAHPPCRYLAVSGARWFARRKKEQEEALDFVRWFFDSDVSKLCVENPVSVISTRVRRPDQYIQPYEFGHPETKKTCLWLRGLPRLTATNVVSPVNGSVMWRLGPSVDRRAKRSRTYEGVARAMALQWGGLC